MGRIPKRIIGFFVGQFHQPTAIQMTFEGKFLYDKIQCLKTELYPRFFFHKTSKRVTYVPGCSNGSASDLKWKFPASNICPPTGCQVG
jgi:hypothetical protein